MRYYLPILLGMGIIFSGSAFAQSTQDIEIILSSSTYNYGDKLDYRIIVSEITGEDAFVYVTDETGKKSQILTIPIRNTELRIVSPFGFDSVIWKEGKYELELQYSGAVSNTGFTILDDGSIAIPYWVKDIAKLWIGNQAPDREYAKSLQYLINEEIIINSEISDELRIPEWFRITTAWWINNQISDAEYGECLQYLINEKVILIPYDQESVIEGSSESTL